MIFNSKSRLTAILKVRIHSSRLLGCQPLICFGLDPATSVCCFIYQTEQRKVTKESIRDILLLVNNQTESVDWGTDSEILKWSSRTLEILSGFGWSPTRCWALSAEINHHQESPSTLCKFSHVWSIYHIDPKHVALWATSVLQAVNIHK